MTSYNFNSNFLPNAFNSIIYSNTALDNSITLDGDQNITGNKIFLSDLTIGDDISDTLIVESNAILNNVVVNGSFQSATTTNLENNKANDNAVVKLTGAQTIAGNKTFSNPLVCNSSLSVNQQVNIFPQGADVNRYWYFNNSNAMLGCWDTLNGGSKWYIDKDGMLVCSKLQITAGGDVTSNIGNAEADLLNINSTCNIKNNCTIGTGVDDDLTVNSLSVFNQNVNFNKNVVLYEDLQLLGNLNVPPSSISDSALTSNVVLKDSDNIFIADNSFNNVNITGNLIISENSINTNSYIPHKGLHNIYTNTNSFTNNVLMNSENSTLTLKNEIIPDNGLSSNVPLKDTSNNFTFVNTFEDIVINNSIDIPDNSINKSKIIGSVATLDTENTFTERQHIEGGLTVKSNGVDNMLVLTTQAQLNLIGNFGITANSIFRYIWEENNFKYGSLDGTKTQWEIKPTSQSYFKYGFSMDEGNILIEDVNTDEKLILENNKLELWKYDVEDNDTLKKFVDMDHALTTTGLIGTYLHNLQTNTIECKEIRANNVFYGTLTMGTNPIGSGGGTFLRMTNLGEPATGEISGVSDMNTVNINFTGLINDEITPENILCLQDISENIQSQINNKANIISPNFSGIPTVVTPATITYSTQIANCEFVKNVIGELIDSSPTNLDTLNELSNALNNDANFSTTVTNLISTKVSQISYNTDKEIIENDISQNAYDISLKVDISEYIFDKAIIENDISENMQNILLKVDISDYNFKQASQDTNITTNYNDILLRVTQSSYDTKQSSQDTLIAAKVDISEYNTKQASQDSLISSKVDISEYNTKQASQDALISTKADINNPTFTGIVTAPNPTQSTNNQQIATTSFVKTEINNLINGASTAYDTLSEIAAAMTANDNNITTTLTNSIGTKLDISQYSFDKTIQDALIATNTTNISNKLDLSGGTITGNLISQSTLSIHEIVNDIDISTGSATLNYNLGGVYNISGLESATNFTLNIININPNNNTKITNTMTLLIDTSTYKAYCNTITVNGVSRTMIYTGGSTNIDIADATMVMQTISVVYTNSSTVPTYTISSVIPCL